MKIEHVADFADEPSAFAPIEARLVVKSQDQIERRSRLIESVTRGRVGRIEERPVSEGLVVCALLTPGKKIERLSALSIRAYREPRGLAALGDGTALVAEIDRVLHISAGNDILREYRLPGFGFLHSVVLSSDESRFLVVSSGFDLIVEVDRVSGAATWDWLAWEHGFNPTMDGVYLTRDPEEHRQRSERGETVHMVDFNFQSTHGLMTSARSNHPNSATYGSGLQVSILATLGHSGEVIEIDRASGNCSFVVRGMHSMPHGIQSYGDGWIVTNTMLGECWILSKQFKIVRKLIFASLPGKPQVLGDNEWLQCVSPINENLLLGLDANRGIFMVDLAARRYAHIPVDENWCVHMAVATTTAQTCRSG